MNTSYEIAIIGGGVIGSSIAYHLAKQGQKVILLEKGSLAQGASSAAAGMLGAQSEEQESEAFFHLARKSRELFPLLATELKEYSGIDIGLVSKGTLKVALTVEQVKAYQKLISFHLRAGEQADWISENEARTMEPHLSDQILGGVYIEKDGHVQAPKLSLAFAKSAAVLGAVIREFAEVRSVLTQNGSIIGIETNEGRIDCERVVVATGTGRSDLLAQLGLSLPIFPVKGECFSVTTHAPLLQRTVFAEGCYLVPKAGGRLVVGATMVERSFERSVSVAGITSLLMEARRLVPAIANATWESAWAGLRPQTPDGLPYLGEAAGCKGLYVACGHFRNGILLSPITGEVMADLIAGKPPRVPIDAFRLDRTLAAANLQEKAVK
jgi:glycine oxidase